MTKDEVAEALKSLRCINKQIATFTKANDIVPTAELIKKLKDTWSDLLKRMDKLTSLESSIIVEHYINLKTIVQITREFFYSERQIKRIIKDSLEKMAD